MSQPPGVAARHTGDGAAQAASRRSGTRLILAEVGCMIIVIAGVFLAFVPLVALGFALSVVAVVVA